MQNFQKSIVGNSTFNCACLVGDYHSRVCSTHEHAFPQQKLAHVALQMMRAGLPLAQTYATHQAELRLELVLSEERLSSLEGLAASLETLAQLERLVETHKAAWRQWVVETTRQLTTVLEHFTEDERAETSQKLMAVLQWQIAAHRRSVAARAEWIDAASIICRLAQQGREIEPAANGPVFANEEDLAEFHRQLARVDAAAAVEHQLFEEHAARIWHNMEKLQVR